MFSKTCEYALRALIYITQQTKDGGRIGIKDIASGIDSPEYFIAKILQDLSRKGFVQSAKGPTGGFYLDSISLNRSLAEIVKEMDGDKIFTGCALGLKECSESHPCPVHNEFRHIRNNLQNMLNEMKIGDFVSQLEAQKIFLRR
ncbi:RrF2 family transcriptional regulator [Chryseobacterium sp. POL2]|uniref:RrF2 family transcriptional regulator n=1 Tax=Chryseobacterium sp. POL2 TaxID=2713414 RepID=UPI0013E1C09E|nr:Rrf2 family transcriptional regulator [Chryseobacterium sp. POL2]QIG88222.1 Rrf2 family transcriptional regulator [Chryseobacterium sp. POL2]